MKKAPLGICLGAAVLAVSLGGCVAGPEPGTVYASFAPPTAEVEVVGVAPGPAYVWIGGHHVWRGGGYHWEPGRFEKRPQPGARWVPGQWRHHSHGWYWRDGRWK